MNQKKPVIVSMAEVPRREIEWLWLNRIPLGGLTLIIGDPGTGKSYVCYDLIARLSSGVLLPYDKRAAMPPKTSVLMFERNPSTSVRPRLEDLGANLDNIKWLQGTKGPSDSGIMRVTLSDVAVIEHA